MVDNPNKWLNVRSGPGKNYPLQFQLEKGTVVDIIAEENGWYQIRSGSRIGWASGDYIKPVEDKPAPEEPAPEPEYPEDQEEPSGEAKLSDAWERLLAVREKLEDAAHEVAEIMTLIDELGG